MQSPLYAQEALLTSQAAGDKTASRRQFSSGQDSHVLCESFSPHLHLPFKQETLATLISALSSLQVVLLSAQPPPPRQSFSLVGSCEHPLSPLQACPIYLSTFFTHLIHTTGYFWEPAQLSLLASTVTEGGLRWPRLSLLLSG